MDVPVIFSMFKILCFLSLISVSLGQLLGFLYGIERDTNYTECVELDKPGWTPHKFQKLSLETWPWNCLLSRYNEYLLYEMVNDICSTRDKEHLSRNMLFSCHKFSWNISFYNEGWPPDRAATSFELQKIAELGDLDFMKHTNLGQEDALSSVKNDPELLVKAALSGDLQMIKFLIYEKKINVKPPTDMPNALHSAVTSGNFQMIRFFVETLNYDVNAKDNFGRTPAHLAAMSSLLILKYLINTRGADMNAKTDADETLLHCAAAKGQSTIVKYLVDKKNMSLDVEDLNGKTPLKSAVSNDNLNVVKYLLEKKKLNVDRTELLRSAICESRLSVIRYLVDQNMDIKDSHGRSSILLKIALQEWELPVVKYLVLEKKVDVECNVASCPDIMSMAIDGGDLELVKYLVDEKGVNVNHTIFPWKQTILQYALDHFGSPVSTDILEYRVVEQNVDFNCTDQEFCRKILKQACAKGYFSIIVHLDKTNKLTIDMEKLLSMTTSGPLIFNFTTFLIDEKEEDVEKILLPLIEFQRVDVVRQLVIQKKVDFNCVVDEHICRKVLHAAVEYGDFTLVKYLLDEKDADNMSDELLQRAAEVGNLNIIKYFINGKKADINCTELLRIHLTARLSGERIPCPRCHYFRLNTITIKYLVDVKKADIDNLFDRNGWNIVLQNATFGRLNLDFIKYLIFERNIGIGMNYSTRSAVLRFASVVRDLDLTKYIFSEGADGNNSELIHIAVKTASPEIIKFLFTLNGTADANSTELLYEYLKYVHRGFLSYCDLDILKLFANEKGARIANSSQLLHEYMRDAETHIQLPYDHLNFIKYLVEEKKADINARNDFGENLLGMVETRASRSIDVFKYLLGEKGADIRSKNRFGENLLHRAIFKNNLHLVRYLVEERNMMLYADDVDSQGHTALSIAQGYGRTPISKYLENKKQNVVHAI